VSATDLVSGDARKAEPQPVRPQAEAARTALLIVGNSPGAELFDRKLLGVTLLRRMEVAARRAGFEEFRVFGTAASAVKGDKRGVPRVPAGRIVLLFGPVLVEPAFLRTLAETPAEFERLYHDGKSVAWIETSRPEDLRAALSSSEADPLAGLARRWKAASLVPPPEAVCPIRGTDDLARGERWLLARLLKDNEGFMSRYVERRISLAVSRRLARTFLTPNAMTGVSVAVGIAGALFFLSPRPVLEFAGALIFLLHSILDGCDGELARLKFQESRAGGVLDYWGDNLVHVAVFGCIAIGWSRAVGQAWPLGLGAAAVAGTLLSAGFVYLRTMTDAHEGPLFHSVSREPETRLSRFADHLARRDFIYVVVILSAFGKAHWFLTLAAFGAPLFFVVLLVIVQAERHRGGRR
jgi:phosphatidylglycerophosphate synthase